jgi:hypothetical protein
MKCLYYLAPSLDSTHQISDDLHESGVDDWYLHVVTQDEAGLKREHIHSSNYLETLDLLRSGFIGANLGFIIGVVGAGLLMLTEPFGPIVPNYVYLVIVVVATMFGSWEGGLYGVATKNQKLNRFQDEIEAGKYLILIYAIKDQEEKVRELMRNKHPEARHVATDRHYINPFRVVRRRRRRQARKDLSEAG